MTPNRLHVARAEFTSATRAFSRKRTALGSVLLTCESGFLSIESGEYTAVMHAVGEWHGRAAFSPEILRALATVPPSQDPVVIAYEEGRLTVGTFKFTCEWTTVSKAFIKSAVEPSLVDLLALERTLPRVEIKGSELGKQVRSARDKAERRIRNAMAQLAELEVTETDIRALVEARIARRFRE